VGDETIIYFTTINFKIIKIFILKKNLTFDFSMPNAKKKAKIINDPVYGFITISDDLILNLIDHPYFQRLRNIKQMGMASLVYPGALHTRFHHAIGAMHLMGEALSSLKNKGVEISEKEFQGALIAILLHDIGHGPFSHALENTLVSGIHHEDLSLLFMKRLNQIFNNGLQTALEIFTNKHPKKFLHQLVASQLDIDRLDYLLRDSYFTGVSEGVISSDRIIKLINVHNNQIVVEDKGIYSIEKFIIARRLMYWQVYLHKAVISAENLLINILKRARELADERQVLFASPAFEKFLYNKYNKQDFNKNDALLASFSELDDYDIYSAIKVWTKHSDFILSTLSTCLTTRQLYKIELRNEIFSDKEIEKVKNQMMKKHKISDKEADYFVFSNAVSNEIYNSNKIGINILYKNGKVIDLANASDQLNVEVLNKTVKKHFLCYLR
jgi:uncharacterized protein